MRNVPIAVDAMGGWLFAKVTDVGTIKSDFAAKITEWLDRVGKG